jgi:long-chain acyl-CoA synthetase
MGEMLRNAASHNPDGTAIVFSDFAANYAQLNDYVDRFANGLAELGLSKKDRVALYLPNTPQFVVSYYGILRLGAVVVACSPLYKERELLHQLEDSEAKAIICLTSNYETVKKALKDSTPRTVVVADPQDFKPKAKNESGRSESPDTGTVIRFRKMLRANASRPIDVEVDPSRDIALLQYTGGTTGTPKGAVITHRNLVVNAVQFATWLGFRHDDVHLAALPLFHIYGMTTSMNAPIYSASKIVLMPKFEVTQLFETVDRHKPTVFCGVPTMYTALVNHPEVKNHDLRSIRVCISGAAPLPGEVQRKFEQITGGRLVEGYGLSETSPVTHVNPLDDPGKNRVGSIGIPIFDTEAKIVDLETGEKDLSVNEFGELVIRGPQVMSGYWRRIEETADALRNGWVHTGDIARVDADGYFYIVDRKKDMINVSGLKVYPREVEEVLYENPKVAEACVVGVQDPYRGERVKAYIVLKANAAKKATPDEMIQFCKERIADYKVPSEVEFISQMPKTAAGKILRRAFRQQT